MQEKIHFFLISILFDFQRFFNHSAFLHVSNEYFKNHILTRGHGPRSSHSLWNFENLKKNDTFGPLGLKWGPKLKLCWLIWFSTNMTNVLWNFEYCSLKFFFKILTLPTPLGLKWGHKPKFFWLIWFSTNMTNVLWNFEHSSLKNKIFKILTLLPPPRTQMGPQTKILLTDLIFNSHDQRSLKFSTL